MTAETIMLQTFGGSTPSPLTDTEEYADVLGIQTLHDPAPTYFPSPPPL